MKNEIEVELYVSRYSASEDYNFCFGSERNPNQRMRSAKNISVLRSNDGDRGGIDALNQRIVNSFICVCKQFLRCTDCVRNMAQRCRCCFTRTAIDGAFDNNIYVSRRKNTEDKKHKFINLINTYFTRFRFAQCWIAIGSVQGTLALHMRLLSKMVLQTCFLFLIGIKIDSEIQVGGARSITHLRIFAWLTWKFETDVVVTNERI